MPEAAVDLLRRNADVLRSRAELELERSQAIPDLTLSAGVRQFRETDDSAFLVGVSIPIPVFDRNRGAIERAGADVVATERSEERRVGKECVSTCRSRWSPYHYKKNKNSRNTESTY